MDAKTREERISYLQNFFQKITPDSFPQDIIPSEVERDYTPSGKFKASSPFILLIGGLIGMGVGYGISWIVSGISMWVFGIFEDSGMCFNILFIPAGFLYVLAPLCIPIMAGVLLIASGEISGCRSPKLASTMGAIVGLAASGLAIYQSMGLFDGVNRIMNLVESLELGITSVIVTIGLGLFYWLVFWVEHYVWFGIITLIGVFLTIAMASDAGKHPFCEKSNKHLKEKLIGFYKLEGIAKLLMGLLQRNKDLISGLEASNTNEKESLQINLWSNKGHESNIIEVTANYLKREHTKDGVKESSESRMIYSEWLDKNQLKEMLAIIKYDLKKWTDD